MGTITIDVWLFVLGAIAGVAGALVARGRSRLVKAAVAGAAAVFLANLARGIF
jgi:hypothetical protein